jgi:hypothetical protein
MRAVVELDDAGDIIRWINFGEDDVRDNDGQVTYEPILGGWVAKFDDGRVENVYLNPSGGSDDGVATVFLYVDQGEEVVTERALLHITMGETP